VRFGPIVLRPLGALVVGLMLVASVGPVAAQNQSRIIKVLAMGKASSTPTLTAWLTAEPSTDPTVIATRAFGEVTGAVIMRYMRIYFPRTYDQLLTYEFIFLAQVDMSFISAGQARWIYDALKDYPKAAMNDRSIMSGVSAYYEMWRNSILPEAFPNDVDAVIADDHNFQGHLGPLIVKDDPSLPNIMKPYKAMIEPVYPLYGGLNAVPKPGSVILSYTKNSVGVGSPLPGQIAHVFYWKWNRSITFTFRDMVTDSFWSSPAGNPYALDIIANMIWWSTGRDLPDDPLMVHDYRRLVFNYAIQKSLLTSLLDFAEIFGADSSKIYAASEATEEYRTRAARDYLDKDFVAAHDAMKMAMAELEKLEDDAMRLKDKAMFWVYLVQWLATTGVFLAAAVVLWSLMVRRRLYREVSSTRLSA